MRTTARRHVERGAFAPEEQGQREGSEMEQDHNRIKKKKLLKEEGFAREQGREFTLQVHFGSVLYFSKLGNFCFCGRFFKPALHLKHTQLLLRFSQIKYNLVKNSIQLKTRC